MENHSKPLNINLNNKGYRPSIAFSNAQDEANELIVGTRDHDKAHGGGDETTGSIHDHWHTLQAFAGVGW